MWVPTVTDTALKNKIIEKLNVISTPIHLNSLEPSLFLGIAGESIFFSYLNKYTPKSFYREKSLVSMYPIV